MTERHDRFMSRGEVLSLVPVHMNTLRRWEAAGKFPKRITISQNLVVWRASEIEAWMEAPATMTREVV